MRFEIVAAVNVRLREMIFWIELQAEAKAFSCLTPVAASIRLHRVAKARDDIDHVGEGFVVMIIENFVHTDWLSFSFDYNEIDVSVSIGSF